MYDQKFAKFLKNVDKYISILQLYDGVITPDCTLPKRTVMPLNLFMGI